MLPEGDGDWGNRRADPGISVVIVREREGHHPLAISTEGDLPLQPNHHHLNGPSCNTNDA
jgi:hypothetical protein